MNKFVDYIGVWWNALTSPAYASWIVLEKKKSTGIIHFIIAGSVFLYAAYGFVMGLFRGFIPGLVSAMKMPMLYVLTMCVCFPIFYILNSLYGPGLRFMQCVRLLIIAVSANAVAISCYIPFSLFFTLSTSKAGYPFIILMHVGVLGVAGVTSLVVIILTFRSTSAAMCGKVRPFFMLTWGAIYGFVGTQMSWILRPMIGTWTAPYAAFRPVSGSFIERVWDLIRQLF
jgi:hypothetical protein